MRGMGGGIAFWLFSIILGFGIFGVFGHAFMLVSSGLGILVVFRIGFITFLFVRILHGISCPMRYCLVFLDFLIASYHLYMIFITFCSFIIILLALIDLI